MIVNSRADESLKDKADLVVYSSTTGDNVVNFNGNDAVGLYHNGILIDVIGEINNSADWGKDVSLVRSTTSISPNTQFVWDEWIKLTKNDFSHIDNHKPLLDQESNIIERYYSDCNSIVVNNLAANSTFYIDIKADGRTSVNVAKLITYDAPVVSAIDNKMDFNYYTTNNGLYINDIATLSTIGELSFSLSNSISIIIMFIFCFVGALVGSGIKK